MDLLNYFLNRGSERRRIKLCKRRHHSQEIKLPLLQAAVMGDRLWKRQMTALLASPQTTQVNCSRASHSDFLPCAALHVISA